MGGGGWVNGMSNSYADRSTERQILLRQMRPEWARKHKDKETDRLHGPELRGSALTRTDKTDET